MPRTIKTPLQLMFGENSFNTYVYVPHNAIINVGNNDSYTVAEWFQSAKKAGHSISEKWYDDGPPTVDKYPWGIRGPKSTGAVGFNIYDGTNNPGGDSLATTMNDSQEHQIVGVRDFTNDVVKVYVDGASARPDLADTTTGDVSTDRHLMIGGRGMGITERFTGKLGRLTLFSGVVSGADIAALYTGTDPANTKLLDLHFDEGEGLVAYDSSGNGLNGTISAQAEWRLVRYGNLITNSDFSLVPAGSVATTTTSRHLDGTAVGTTTPNIYGWFFNKSGTSEGLIDSSQFHSGTHSLKASTTAVASWIELKSDRSTSYNTLPSAGTGFPLKPSTSYDLTYWMKTNYVSGDSNDGAYVSVLEANASGTNIGSTATVTKVKVTQDWTQYQTTFTTSANAYRGHIECRIYGHTGVATLIMDAWFDDITLKETSPPRPLASRSGLATRTVVD